MLTNLHTRLQSYYAGITQQIIERRLMRENSYTSTAKLSAACQLDTKSDNKKLPAKIKNG